MNVNMYKLGANYDYLSFQEITTNYSIEGNNFSVSILPIPNSKNALTSVFVDSRPLVINKICVPNEQIIGHEYKEIEVSFDLMYIYEDKALENSDFDISYLGNKLSLFCFVRGE